MASNLPGSVRQFGVAIAGAARASRSVLGIVYPLVMTGVAQVLFHGNANGSIVQVNGKDRRLRPDRPGVHRRTAARRTPTATRSWSRTRSGSRPGRPRSTTTRWAARPRSTGRTTPTWSQLIDERRKAVAELEGVDPSQVPPDAVTASGSGLDPHISPAYAALQVNRVARERGLDVAKVQQLVKENTKGRTLGFLGEPAVNVVTLNNALAALG